MKRIYDFFYMLVKETIEVTGVGTRLFKTCCLIILLVAVIGAAYETYARQQWRAAQEARTELILNRLDEIAARTAVVERRSVSTAKMSAMTAGRVYGRMYRPLGGQSTLDMLWRRYEKKVAGGSLQSGGAGAPQGEEGRQ